MRRSLLLGLIVLFPSLIFANTQQSIVKETLVSLGNAITGEEIFVDSVKVSPDLQHVGYVSRIGGSFHIWLDGVSQKGYSGVTQQSPYFSPQKNRIAYVAHDNDKMVLVVDGQEQARYKKIGTVTFSQDGSRIAYRAEDERGRQMIVVDGNAGPAFDLGVNNEVGVIFSPDSQHVAYVGLNTKKSCIFVKDNKKMRSFEQITDVKFSPDSKHFAYIAFDKDEWSVVVDENKGTGYSLIKGLMFSPDGSRVIYTAEKNHQVIIVDNNREITGGSGVFAPTFSPDGRRFAFLMKESGNQFRYVIDGKPELPVDNPGRMIFNHDSTSEAYAAQINGKWYVIKDGVQGPAFNKIYAFTYFNPTNDILYAADTEDGRTCVIYNSVPGKPYVAIGLPVICDDGQKYGYVARQNDKEMFLVINGQEQTPYPIIGIPMSDESEKGKFKIFYQQPYFSHKGNRLAFPVYDPDKNKAFMVVDGKPQASFDAILQPLFSDDEKHIAYMAKTGSKWQMVVDGQVGSLGGEGMLRGSVIAFDPARNCFFALMAGKKQAGLAFFRLEAKINDPS